jgi:hypothetical protein
MSPFDDRPAAPVAAPRPGKQSRSLLVRLWAEPRDVAGQPGGSRGLVRDLKTGEETWVSTPEQLAELMTRHARALEGELEPEAPERRRAAPPLLPRSGGGVSKLPKEARRQ